MRKEKLLLLHRHHCSSDPFSFLHNCNLQQKTVHVQALEHIYAYTPAVCWLYLSYHDNCTDTPQWCHQCQAGVAGQLYTSQLQHCREGLLEISAYLAGG